MNNFQKKMSHMLNRCKNVVQLVWRGLESPKSITDKVISILRILSLKKRSIYLASRILNHASYSDSRVHESEKSEKENENVNEMEILEERKEIILGEELSG